MKTDNKDRNMSPLEEYPSHSKTKPSPISKQSMARVSQIQHIFPQDPVQNNLEAEAKVNPEGELEMPKDII